VLWYSILAPFCSGIFKGGQRGQLPPGAAGETKVTLIIVAGQYFQG